MEQKSILDQIQELLAAGYGNVKEAVQEPGKFHARALGNLRRQIEENPEEVGMNWTGGGLGGMTRPITQAIKPAKESAKNLEKFLHGEKPQKFYHGTKKEFSEFKPGYSDDLMFFSTNPEFASKWAVGTGGLREPPPGTDEAYKQIKNIEQQLYSKYMKRPEQYDFNTVEGRNAFDADREALKQAVKKETGFSSAAEFEMNAGNRVMPVYLSTQKPFDPRIDYEKIEPFLRKKYASDIGEKTILDQGHHKTGNWLVYENEDVINELKRLGYDSIWLAENTGGPHETLAVFKPTQIKSAIGNRGTYDPTNPDITKKEGGLIHLR